MATVEELLENAETRMGQAIEALHRGFNTMRVGRANPSLVENLQVDYQGVVMGLNQLALITAPDARSLVIQPWDKNMIAPVERAIFKSELGMTPSNDGSTVRLVMPPTTEERRKELLKQVGRRVEEGRIAVRNIRRDVLERLRSLEKVKELSQDEGRRAQQKLQQKTDAHINLIDKASLAKETEVLDS